MFSKDEIDAIKEFPRHCPICGGEYTAIYDKDGDLMQTENHHCRHFNEIIKQEDELGGF